MVEDDRFVVRLTALAIKIEYVDKSSITLRKILHQKYGPDLLGNNIVEIDFYTLGR